MAVTQPDGAITRAFASRATDVKFAPDGASFYVAVGSSVYQVSVATNDVIAAYALDGPAGAFDLSADGHYLTVLLNTPSSPAFHTIDTVAGTVTDYVLPVQGELKNGFFDVAYLDDGTLLLSQVVSNFAPIPPLLRFDFSSGTYTVAATNMPSATLLPSLDHDTVFIIGAGSSAPNYIFTSDDGITAAINTRDPYLSASMREDVKAVGAVSPDEGTFISGDAFLAFDSGLQSISNFPGFSYLNPNGMIFSPDGETLFVALSSLVMAIDVATWTAVAVYPVGDTVLAPGEYPYSYPASYGTGYGDILQVSSDGRYLSVMAADGVQIIDLSLALSLAGPGDDIIDEGTDQFGLGGDDTLGGAGAQVMLGGEGDDTYVVDSASDSIIELAGQGYDKIVLNFTPEYYYMSSNVEELEYTGTGNLVVFGSGDEKIIGAGGNDSFYGRTGADELIGNDGNDRLAGEAGGDIVRGGAGNDLLVVGSFASLSVGAPGSADNDTARDQVFGGDGDDIVWIGAGDDADGGAGNDQLNVSFAAATAGVTFSSADFLGGGSLVIAGGSISGFETVGELGGSAFADTITITGLSGQAYVNAAAGDDVVRAGGNAASVVIDGGEGNDLLEGGAADDELRGGNGNDALIGGTGQDSLFGGYGDDTYYLDDAAAQVFEGFNEGYDRISASVSYVLASYQPVERLELTDASGTAALDLTGGNSANTILGNNGTNLLDGAGGDDTLHGFGGNDYLYGATGLDNMYGGAGDDAYYMATDDGDRVWEFAGEGYDVVSTEVNYTLPDVAYVERLEAGTLGATSALYLGGSYFDNLIVGNAGNNTLRGFLGNDTLQGLGGDDYLIGDEGADVMYGGTGNDTFYVNTTDDRVFENPGEGTNDRVATEVSFTLPNEAEIEVIEAVNLSGTAIVELGGSQYGNTITGDAGNNLLRGYAGNDTLFGSNGNDTLVGDEGNDTMYGGTGNDAYFVDAAGDTVVENASEGTSDRVATSVSYTLSATAEIEIFETTSLSGTGGINLTGSNTANTLIGNDGANWLDGKGGSDVLVGLGGADTFTFSTALGADNVDRIEGFEVGVDKIALDDAILADLNPGSMDPNRFVVGPAALDADDRIVYDANAGVLYFDADGNGAGAAVQIATLAGGLALSATDLLIV